MHERPTGCIENKTKTTTVECSRVEGCDEHVEPEVELVAVQKQGVSDVSLQYHLPLQVNPREYCRCCIGSLYMLWFTLHCGVYPMAYTAAADRTGRANLPVTIELWYEAMRVIWLSSLCRD